MIKPQYKKIALAVLTIIIIAVIGAQFVPTSLSAINPPVTGEPPWDSEETRSTFISACADCHSNQTVLPWYSSVAPASWIIERDILEGRRHFNVSEWDKSQRGGDEAADQVQRGAMPIGPYLLMHPSANLNAAEKKKFVEGLHNTFGTDSVQSEQ